ncbi:sulfatase-like hydrolase/transferase [Rhodospirillaceae bacterium KN72]|uniref:Sulfatase-like hydrolase/transferase n=1 Tax=Pacificispira spongiicola TaxID=2729598 RepID=A0A7Y0HFC0_9PROT|nr:sulfatase-like hydrolase/transferase [Pacificispira spongiicola]
MKAAGHETVSIGKPHYRSPEYDDGFAQEIVALHVSNGEGWGFGILRPHDHTCFDNSQYAQDIGPGDDSYTEYDVKVRDHAVDWLAQEGAAARDKPWALFVSFLRPHYPLTCPKPFYDMYDPERLPPRLRRSG